VSGRERFFIDFLYDRQVTGNLEKAYQTLESWQQAYPGGDPNPLGLLGGISSHGTGRLERAVEASQKLVAAEPDVQVGYANLASGLFFLDRFAEAESALQKADERKLASPNGLLMRYHLAVLRGDDDRIDQIAARASGKPGTQQRVAHAEA